MGVQQKADFQFLCDRSVDEVCFPEFMDRQKPLSLPAPSQPSSPTHYMTWNGTHTFQWRTKHACGSQSAKPMPPLPSPPTYAVRHPPASGAVDDQLWDGVEDDGDIDRGFFVPREVLHCLYSVYVPVDLCRLLLYG